MNEHFDLCIVGSGFGGSLLAMIGRRLGLSVIILEKGSHPRFAIGESSSPLADLLLEEISAKYDLPRLMPLTTYGQWQKTYQQIGCGLKRGFTYYHHLSGKPYSASTNRDNQLLVAASPCDYVSDTHWFRADFDHFLQKEAVSLGTEYLDNVNLCGICTSGSGDVAVDGDRLGKTVNFTTRFLVDATGPRGFISRALSIPEVSFANYPATQALFSHFLYVPRCESMPEFAVDGEPPYPADDAALHHVFDGGWMWVLRFNNGITSAGFAMEAWLARELQLNEGEPAWARILGRYPSIQSQFEDAAAVQPFVYSSRLPYRSQTMSGLCWAMLPSAAGFVDPLFSTGIPLTLLGILRLAPLLEGLRRSGITPDQLNDYSRTTLEEVDWVAYFVSVCYRSFRCMRAFATFSMFYFAAASYAEIARRIGRSDLACGFLRANDPSFRKSMRKCASELEIVIANPKDSSFRNLEGMVKGELESVNIAGLCDRAKKNWYPVDLADVIQGAPKFGSNPVDMQKIVDTAPWAATTAP